MFSLVSQHLILGVHGILRRFHVGAETRKKNKNTKRTLKVIPFVCVGLLLLKRNRNHLPSHRSMVLKALFAVQGERMNWTKSCEKSSFFGIVAVEVSVALFLVLLKKLHRHKLKTIFNFKITELSNEAAILLAFPFVSFLVNPFFELCFLKMSQDVCQNTVCYHWFIFFSWRVSLFGLVFFFKLLFISFFYFIFPP